MKVVFLEEVKGSGQVGEIKEVRNGYARNYLLPRGLAAPATKVQMERAAKLAKVDAVRQEKVDVEARLVADRIDGATVTLTARVGEQGRLFGSVTATDIAEQLTERAGQSVDHRQVLLGQVIKAIGSQEVRVRLTRNVSATVTVDVRPEGGEAEPQAEAAGEPAGEESAPVDEGAAAEAEGAAPTDEEPQAESD